MDFLFCAIEVLAFLMQHLLPWAWYNQLFLWVQSLYYNKSQWKYPQFSYNLQETQWLAHQAICVLESPMSSFSIYSDLLCNLHTFYHLKIPITTHYDQESLLIQIIWAHKNQPKVRNQIVWVPLLSFTCFIHRELELRMVWYWMKAKRDQDMLSRPLDLWF